jgi:SOS-response transcriptional repressor LexA
MRRTWLERRIEELARKDKSKAGLARWLDLPSARISEIVAMKRRISAREIKRMAQYLEWTDTELLAHIAGEDVGERERPSSTGGTKAVRVIGAVQAGEWRGAVEWPADQQFEILVPVASIFTGMTLGALQVRGPSMNQVYPEGAYLVCADTISLAGFEVRTGDKVIVQRRSVDDLCEVTVKEYRLDDQGRAWLWPRSDDPEFQQPWRVVPIDQDGDNDDIRITGLVIASYRSEVAR